MTVINSWSAIAGRLTAKVTHLRASFLSKEEASIIFKLFSALKGREKKRKPRKKARKQGDQECNTRNLKKESHSKNKTLVNT